MNNMNNMNNNGYNYNKNNEKHVTFKQVNNIEKNL